MINVVFLLAPGVLLLDLAGPAQVFSSANGAGSDYLIHHVADDSVVASSQGLTLAALDDWPELGEQDLVVVPGRADRQRRDPYTALSAASLTRLRRHHDRGGRVASICSGAFDLGRAGLLDNRRCTTHHGLQAELSVAFPRARVVPDVLFITDDKVITSAGIASGIDLALNLVSNDHGPAIASAAARDMVIYARRNGDAPQLSPLLRHRSHLNDLVHRVQDVIDRRFSETLRLDALAEDVATSPRTLTRSFRAATGTTPLKYQQSLRLERAEQLIMAGSTVESASRAVGFEDGRMLRRLRATASE